MSRHALLRFALLLATLLAAACAEPPRPGADSGPSSLDATVGEDAMDAAAAPDVRVACDASDDRPARADVMTLATAGPGGSLALGAACDPSNNQCAPGTLCCRPCCLADAQAVCTTPDSSGSCPLPDVSVDGEYLRTSIRVTEQTFNAGACEIAEGCIGGPGRRRLLHFGMRIPNHGSGDMHLGAPTRTNPNFNFMNCHGHVHYEGYGQYRLLTPDGCVAARGHKNGFCVMDLAPADPGANPQPPRRYGCSDMGISRGWADIYGVGTSCQWIDITDVPPGNYVVEATVNPEFNIPESNFANNTVRIPVTVDAWSGGPNDGGVGPGGDARTDAPPAPTRVTDACPPTGPAGVDRDCGWFVEGVFRCTAGARVTLGCSATCTPSTGRCSGDPMLRVCIGPNNECPAATALAQSDDACGAACPSTTFTCPATGSVTVLSSSHGNSGPYSCTVMTR